jgi:SPP1 family predicted phage head-tail adaptor
MNAYNLEHLIEIQILNSSEEWEKLANCKAKANGAIGSESTVGGAEQTRNQVEFEIRYSDDFAALDPRTTRIIFRGLTYDVIAPPDNFMFQNKWLKLRTVVRHGR